MKKLIIGLFALLLSLGLTAQILDPVDWSFEVKPLAGDTFELNWTATIDNGWWIYSQEVTDGPIPTAVYLDKGEHYLPLADPQEGGNRKEGFDETFGVNVIKYTDEMILRQKVRWLDTAEPIEGFLEYMSCDDTQCLPPEEEIFSLLPAEAGKKNGLLEPVTWTGSVQPLAGDQYQVTFRADLEEGWTIYSQHNGPESSVVPTGFYFDDASHFEAPSGLEEMGDFKEGMDPIFQEEVKKFVSGPVIFQAALAVSDPQQPITGYLEFMTCDDTQCLPPEVVSFRILPAQGQLLLGEEADGTDQAAVDTGAGTKLFGYLDKPNLERPAGSCANGGTAVPTTKTGIGKIFILGFLGGLLALLTPCVFPMVPLTVSYFTKGAHDRKKGLTQAGLYAFFILLVYLLLSLPFHIMDSINPDILNDISTNVWLNLAFFAIFVFFAFSFFGYYELTLPSSWTNRTSSAEGLGGLVGVFFMALTLALVSFSCTGPILGSLLAGALSTNGGATQLTAGMGGFGLALALPFGLFAAFPSVMNALPKSGGWLNTVKVVLGFLELALAFKFLSNADLVKDWGLLKIEPFLGIWILVFLGLTLYLFGVIKFPHDSPVKKLSTGRLGLGVASLAFTIYLATGFIYNEQAGTYRSLKLLSGLAPPSCYSIWRPCDCPQGLNCFKDLEAGLTYARQVNKPVLIDFTGHACVNCRKMEEHVWPEPPVYDRIREDYVLISLYTDEKKALPESEQLVVQKAGGGTRKLKTVGNKWSYFQSEYFGVNSQPYYVLITPDGQLLNKPVGYTPDTEKYADFLECGQEAFHRLAQE